MSIKRLLKLGSTIIVIGGIILLFGFIAIQFVPVNRANPPVAHEPNWDSAQTRALVERTCFDCHSNETKWPWYSNIAPASWVVADHVQEGRAKLNFSEWGRTEGVAKEAGSEDDDDEKGYEEEGEDEEAEGEEVEEIVETIKEGEMPLPGYLLLHPKARLTDAEIKQLIRGVEATFGTEAKWTTGNVDYD